MKDDDAYYRRELCKAVGFTIAVMSVSAAVVIPTLWGLRCLLHWLCGLPQ